MVKGLMARFERSSEDFGKNNQKKKKQKTVNICRLDSQSQHPATATFEGWDPSRKYFIQRDAFESCKL